MHIACIGIDLGGPLFTWSDAPQKVMPRSSRNPRISLYSLLTLGNKCRASRGNVRNTENQP